MDDLMMERLRDAGIIPVVKLANPDDALPLAGALQRGGLPLAEITFRTGAAAESIRRIRKGCPDMLVGAGTVLTPEQVAAAAAAGAEFLVAPGLNGSVVEKAKELGLPMIPGVSTATEVEAALELGLSVLKFFPAEQCGGAAAIKALCAPYQNVLFVPTGGINEKNVTDYLALPKVLACGGSWMVKETLIQAGDFDAIERLTRAAVEAALPFGLSGRGEIK